MADGTNTTSSTASLNNNPSSSGTSNIPSSTSSSSLPSTPNHHSSSLHNTTSGSTSSSSSGLNHNTTTTSFKHSQNHHHHHHQQHHHHHHHPNASGGTTILTTQPTKMLNSTTKLIGVKQQNVIHRTTSECMRLSNSERMPPPSSSSSGNGSAAPGSGTASSASGSGSSTPAIPPTTLLPTSRKSKTSSFQITSVTVGTRTSADTGEDSADDLDESHTDDNSRITDLENETPSFSEDTFSKEDVFFSTNAIGTAPVIPTSSQYGLAIVTPDLGGVGSDHSDVHVSVTDSGMLVDGSGKHDGGDMKEVHHRNERFKVVKIESTEPFKRGRWMCMDYLDHTALQPSQPAVSSGQQSVPASSGNIVLTQQDLDAGSLGAGTTTDSGLGMSASNIDLTHLPNGAMGSPQKTCQTDVHIQNMINTNLLAGQSAPPGSFYPPLSANSSPGQTLHQPISMGVGGGTGGQTLPSQNSMPPTAVSYGAAAPPAFIQSNPIPGGVATSGPAQQQQPILNNTQPIYHHQSLPAQPQHPQSQPPLLEHPQQSSSFQQQPPTGAIPVGAYATQSIPTQPQQPLQQQPPQPQSMADVQQHVMTNIQQGQSQPAQFYASTGAIPSSAGSAATGPSVVHHLQGQTLPAGVLHNIVQNNVSGLMPHQPQIQQSNQYIPAPAQMQQVPPAQQPQPQQPVAPQQHQQAMSMGHQPQHVDLNLMQSIANQANFQSMPPQQPQQVQPPPQQGQSLQQPIQMVGVNLEQHSQHYAPQQPQQQLSSADRGVSGVPFSIAQSMPQLSEVCGVQQQPQQFIQNPPPIQQPQQQQQPPQPSSGYASSNHLIGSNIGAAALVQAAGSAIVNNSVSAVNSAMQVEVTNSDLGAAAASVAAAIISPAGTAGSASAVGGGDEAVAPAASGGSSLGAAALASGLVPGGGGDESVANPTGSTEDSERLLQNILDIPKMFDSSQPPSGSATGGSTSPANGGESTVKNSNFDGLARALSSVSAIPTTSTAACTVSHYVKNKRIRRFNVELVPDNTDPQFEPPIALGPRRPSNVFTNLALGNRMETLMASGNSATLPSTPHGSFRFNLEPASVNNFEFSASNASMTGQSISATSTPVRPRDSATSPGIPIPGLRRESMPVTSYSTMMGSPPTGRYCQPMYGGSMGTSPMHQHSVPAVMGMAGAPSVMNYLEVCGGGGVVGGLMNATISRATTPQRPLTGSTAGDLSASGTSAVAIDNKIEQAMDLVKSHLMFAVREEVEVLKEKIAELMDRINQLELENTILKASATQDTLIQLSSMVATPAMQSAKSLPNNAANPTNGPIS